MRIYEKHDNGAVVERCELEDRAGTVFFVLTDPSDGDAVIEEREATTAEADLFALANDTAGEVTKADQIAAFLEANPDPATWTTAQLKNGLEWLLRFKIRELRKQGFIS